MRRARTAELGAWLGLPVDDLWDAFDRAYEPAFLAAPTRGGLRGPVITQSSAAYTASKLAAAGLDRLFDVVCSTDVLGVGKPDPRASHEACRRLGTEPARTAYDGDELRRGVPVVRDLLEVLDLVARDLGAGERTGSIFPRFA